MGVDFWSEARKIRVCGGKVGISGGAGRTVIPWISVNGLWKVLTLVNHVLALYT